MNKKQMYYTIEPRVLRSSLCLVYVYVWISWFLETLVKLTTSVLGDYCGEE